MTYEYDGQLGNELIGAYSQGLAGITPRDLSDEGWVYWLRGFQQFTDAAAKAGLVVIITAATAPVPRCQESDPF